MEETALGSIVAVVPITYEQCHIERCCTIHLVIDIESTSQGRGSDPEARWNDYLSPKVIYT